jgi:hypothetical protein
MSSRERCEAATVANEMNMITMDIVVDSNTKYRWKCDCRVCEKPEAVGIAYEPDGETLRLDKPSS